MRIPVQLSLYAAFFAVLASQLPRRALFFRAADVPARAPSASFVALDDAAYDALVARARMSWQMTSRSRGGAADPSSAEGLLVESAAAPAPLVHGAYRASPPSVGDGFRPADLRPAVEPPPETLFAPEADEAPRPVFPRAELLDAGFILDSPERK